MWVGLSGPFSPQVLADYARYRVKERLQTVPGVGEIQVRLRRPQRPHLDRLRQARRAPASPSATCSRAIQQRARRAARRPPRDRRAAKSTCASSARRSISTSSATSWCSDDRRRSPVYLERRGHRRGRLRGHPPHLARQRRAGAGHGHPQAARLERRRGRARREGRRIAEIQKTLPEGMELGDQLRLHAVHRGVGARDPVRAAALGDPHRARLLAVPRARSARRSTSSWRSRCRSSARWPCIYFFGFTLNTFTLLGLALAVGIVVDDAIMVLENIFRHGEMGKDRVRAAREGTQEISFAALAATLAVCAIFLPVVFMKGDHREVLPAVRRDALRRGAAVVRRGDHARAGALRADAEDRRGAAVEDRPLRRRRVRQALRAPTRACWRIGLRRPLLGAARWRRSSSPRRSSSSRSCPASSCRRRTRAA